jgi:hypothetical protein
MTILDTREIQVDSALRPVVRPGSRPAQARRRPRSSRPDASPLRYRGTGVLMSRASHRRRPITPATTVVLALIAAGITVWLGLVAQLGGVTGGDAPVPHRVAPDSPVGQVIERIRELNQLDSVALDAGQTLIAPIGN